MNKLFHLITVFIVILSTYASLSAQNSSYWNDILLSDVHTSGERAIIPEKFRVLALNITEIRNVLVTAPQEVNVHPQSSGTILYLPLPYGGFGRFKIVDSPVMEQGLADKYPEIKTYLGAGIDDPYATVRLDLTPQGFHAMVMTVGDMIFIDPYARGDSYNYISYYKKDFKPTNREFYCEVLKDENYENRIRTDKSPLVNEGYLHTYRVAIAADGEYTTYHGGTVALGLAAVVTALNRVDGVYEKECSIRMVLVANNNLIIYTNASTDPYTNNNGSTMLGQNQTTCDGVIGTANYDIGHVFSTGGGGVAYLGCICSASNKAGGVTGLTAPIGDPFYIDYVAHEMGHQFGGNHTFNATTGSCGGGNRAASAAYEPGSASTIMGYAGICSPNDLQPHSDAYFVLKSLQEIGVYSLGGGFSCAVRTTTGNHNPVVTVSTAAGKNIPISTPFTISGTATDADNDSLTYCWEEYDLGAAGTWNAPVGTAPIFRSFTPVTTGDRTFPKLSSLLANTTVIGEILPTYARALNFRLIARDNKTGGGGYGFGSLLVTVSAAAGPFR